MNSAWFLRYPMENSRNPFLCFMNRRYNKNKEDCIPETKSLFRRMLAADSHMNIDCVDPLGRFLRDDDDDGGDGEDDSDGDVEVDDRDGGGGEDDGDGDE